MIGLDTNVLVRFIAHDDEVQSPIATRLMAGLTRDEPGFVSSVVLAEISWVLSRSYKASRETVAVAIEGLLRSAEVAVENPQAAYRALARYRETSSAEFADALIAETASVAGAVETVSFDQDAAKQLGMRLLG